MRKAFNIIGLALALLLAFSSCQKAPFLTFTGQKSFTFKDAGGSETITFSCNRAWTVTSSESWLTVSPAKGEANEGGVNVTITCAANTTYDPRNATITISSEGLTETISVSQDTNYGLMSEPTTFNLTNEAQNIEVEVKANVEYTITIDESCKDWISQAGTKALSSTKLTFSIAANESYDDREGKITISQKGSTTSVQPQVITVKQSQTNGLFITTPEYELSNEAHDLTVEVKANIDYEVTSEVDWVKYEPSATKALTTSSFTLKVEKNESYDPRVGTVKVKGGGGLEGVITITQAENLGLFVSPTEKSITKDAQEVEVEVNANVEYDIIVPEEAKGMITTIKKQGGGDTKALSATKYLFGVSENTTYEAREASITFKQKEGALSGTFKISQEQRDTLGIASQKDSLSYDELEKKMIVAANVEHRIIPSEDVDWISISEPQKIGEKEGINFFEYTFTIKSKNISLSPRRTSFVVSSESIDTQLTYIIVQGPIPVPEGAIGSVFSVSATKKVFFSQGNLQATYNSGTYTWGFAAKQYDFIGDAAGNTTIDSQHDGAVVDLFGWSTGATNYGISTSTDPYYYSGDFVDWGKNIGDGNTWYTLSYEEWCYLFNTRTVNGGTGAGKSYTLNITYGGKMGLVLYPDDYAGAAISGTVNNLPEGIVFLPAAGIRDDRGTRDIGYDGDYWSSSADASSVTAYSAKFFSSYVKPDCISNRDIGQSVRLVTEAPAK